MHVVLYAFKRPARKVSMLREVEKRPGQAIHMQFQTLTFAKLLQVKIHGVKPAWHIASSRIKTEVKDGHLALTR